MFRGLALTRGLAQTTEKQRKEDWVAWILAYTQAKRMSELLLDKELAGPLFCNAAIGRALNLEDAVDVLEYMVARGNGEWRGEGKKALLVLYRSYAEWAAMIQGWVASTGQTGNVFTVYELLEGDETARQEFHGIDQALMLNVLRYMEQQGTAKLFTGADPSKMGVKVACAECAGDWVAEQCTRRSCRGTNRDNAGERERGGAGKT